MLWIDQEVQPSTFHTNFYIDLFCILWPVHCEWILNLGYMNDESIQQAWRILVFCSCYLNCCSTARIQSCFSDFVFKIRLIRLGFSFPKIDAQYLNSLPTDSKQGVITNTPKSYLWVRDTKKLLVAVSLDWF